MDRERDNQFVIPVKGLSGGRHTFDFAIGKSFFENYENGDVNDADITASVILEKSSTLITLTCNIKGSLTTVCDRCLGDLIFPVNISPSLLVKFVKTDQEPEDDEVIILEPGESELDLKQFFYDYICLSLPIRHTHEEGKCDPEIEEFLKNGKTKVKESGNGNKAFDKLKDILKNS